MSSTTQTKSASTTSTSTSSIINDEKVVGWRTEELKRVGYSEANADKLGKRGDIDLHAAVDLLKNGCPEETALEILL